MAVAGHHVVGPAVHLQALVGVEAHQLADDDERDVDGEVLDEVDLAPVGDLVDDLVGQLAHVGDQLTYPAGGEALVDQAALAQVLLAVEGDDRHVAGDDGAHSVARAVGLGGARHVEDVGVAAQDPQVVGLVAIDGGVGPEPAVVLPRVVEEAGVTEVEGSGCGAGHPPS